VGHPDETEGIFWDPSCVDNRNARHQGHVRQLQEQLAQATVKVRELECELKHVQKVIIIVNSRVPRVMQRYKLVEIINR